MKKIMILLPVIFFLVSNHASALDYIWQDKTDYVALDSSDDYDASRPVVIGEEKLGKMLSNISYVADSNSVEKQSVFTEKEIQLLSHWINKALIHSDTGQSVVFSVSDQVPAYFGNKRLHVSGTVFFDGKSLNLVFGEIRADLKRLYIRSGKSLSNSRHPSTAELLKFRLSNGDINTPSSKPWSLLETEYVSLASMRGDWVKLRVDNSYHYVDFDMNRIGSDKRDTYEPGISTSMEDLKHRIEAVEAWQNKHDSMKENAFVQLERLNQLAKEGRISQDRYGSEVMQLFRGL